MCYLTMKNTVQRVLKSLVSALSMKDNQQKSYIINRRLHAEAHGIRARRVDSGALLLSKIFCCCTIGSESDFHLMFKKKRVVDII